MSLKCPQTFEPMRFRLFARILRAKGRHLMSDIDQNILREGYK